jgi:hypothetical protein
MIGAFGRRLRLVLWQPDDGGLANPGHDESVDLPEVDFVAYAEDGRLSGRIRLDTARLSDMLNEHDEFQLDGVLAERLPDGGTMVVPEFVVERDELILVLATGPRGDRARRMPTEPHAIALRAGPYLVTGDIHAAHGVDPIVFFRRRRPMVPLTDATIEYRTARGPVREYAGTIVVNRDQLDWVRTVTAGAERSELPGIGADRLGRAQR